MKKGTTIEKMMQGTTRLRDEDVGISDNPLEDSVATHAVVRESPVDIEFRIDAAQRRFIRVKVFRKLASNYFRFTDIACAGNTESDMIQKCGMAAGMIAEQLQNEFGDPVEPSECAKAAGQHFRELVQHMCGIQRVASAAPDKVDASIRKIEIALEKRDLNKQVHALTQEAKALPVGADDLAVDEVIAED